MREPDQQLAVEQQHMQREGVPLDHFREMYEGTPPWEIGGPQPAIVRLAEDGAIRGRVLDVGCGSGDNALYLASRGHGVTGVDYLSAPIESARRKAADRTLSVDFRVQDALALDALGQTYDTLIDSGLFHTFSDEQRARFVVSLRSAIADSGVLHLLCFSELETRPSGPRRVTQDELHAAFKDGWRIESITPSAFEASSNFDGGAKAWLARIAPVPSEPRP